MNQSVHFKISSQELQTLELEKAITDHDCGGVVIFVGNVRESNNGKRVIALEFECYDSMAILELKKIEDEIKMKWPVKHVALYHRSGRVEVGGTAVVAGVSGIHRAEAFAACSFLIERLKQTVPIWKKEIFEDGEEWVSATP